MRIMKPCKPAEKVGDLTPSKKKLKQATLPFQVVTDPVEVSPARKRKLSSPEHETPSKVGKTSKQNEVVIAKDTVVISDDDSLDSEKTSKDKILNPLVKLVDAALQKKTRKGKTPKKQNVKPNKSCKSADKTLNIDQITDDCMKEDDLETSKNEKQTTNKTATQENKIKANKYSKRMTNHIKIVSNIGDKPKHKSNEEIVNKGSHIHENSKYVKVHDKSDMQSDKSDEEHSEKSVPAKDKEKQKYIKTNKEEDITDVEKDAPNMKCDISEQDKDGKNQKYAKSKQNKDESEQNCDTSEQEEDDSDQNSDKSNPKDDDTKQKIDKTIHNKSKSKQTKSGNNENDTDKKNQTSPSQTSDVSGTSDKDSETIEDDNVDDPATLPDEQVTPKRSPRRKIAQNEQTAKDKQDEDEPMDISASPDDNKLSDGSISQITTPKHKKNILSEDINSSPSATILTPKQLQRKLESAKKREEREREKQERDKKKQQEKEERAKQRQEKEDQKRKEREEKEEQKKKEREEKEEQRKKEKEEKEKQKELEKKEREEKDEQKKREKEEKEEQKRKEREAKEEERRKKVEAVEEEKRQKELEKHENELKKKKAAAAFVNFFVPKQKIERQIDSGPQSKSSMLSSFMVKTDMRLAPSIRNQISLEDKKKLESFLEDQTKTQSELYLQCLRDNITKPRFCDKTWPLDDKDDDDVVFVESGDELPTIDGAGEAIICNETIREKLRPKLLSFHENRRPPYWGTWRKKSSSIKPRNPFRTDGKLLDYEVDSEEEWEEEEGESISGSVADDEENNEADDYEVDNEFFVPHGYLSDEEATMEEEDVLSLSPETQKAKLKHLEDEFETEMKKPTEKLKPRLYGLLWENSEGGKPEKCVDALWKYFGKLTMIMNDPTPLLEPTVIPEEEQKKKTKKRKKDKEDTEGEVTPEAKKKVLQENKNKRVKTAPKKLDIQKNQPGINVFLTKIKP